MRHSLGLAPKVVTVVTRRSSSWRRFSSSRERAFELARLRTLCPARKRRFGMTYYAMHKFMPDSIFKYSVFERT